MHARSLGLVLATSLGLGLGATAPVLAMHHDKLEAAFKAADKDGDGSLDREEARAMPRVAKQFDRLDADRSGTVTLEELTAGAAAKGRQARERTKDRHEQAKARFAEADRDGDGSLDREEAEAMPHVARDFDRIDADRSGTVTAEELRAHGRERMKDRRRDRRRDADRDDD